MTTILCDKSMIPSINFKKYISQATYHKINLEVIRNILKAFEANSNLIAGVVQVPKVHYNDLITRLHRGKKQTTSVVLELKLFCLLMPDPSSSAFLTIRRS